MKPERIAFLDQLAAILRQVGRPVLSEVVAAELPPHEWQHGGETVRVARQAGSLYNDLVELAKQDRVRRVRTPGDRRVMWEWTGDAGEADGLEAMFDSDEMADLRRVFESEPSVPTARPPLDEVSTVDELLAEMTRQGIAAAWVDHMDDAVLYLAADRIMVLNRQCDATELRDAVTDVLEDRRP